MVPPKREPGLAATGLEHVGRLRHLPWQALGQGLRGLWAGAIPGLAPLRRGDRQAAWWQLGVFLVPLGLALLSGGLAGLGRLSWLVACGWSFSPASECKRRMNVPEPHRTLASLWLSLPAAVAVALFLPILVQGGSDTVFRYAMGQDSLLRGGSYTVVDQAMDTLRPGELVLIERGDVEARLEVLRRWIGLDGLGGEPASAAAVQASLSAYRRNLGQFVVFPVVVVALEEQRLGWGPGGLTVDGVESDAVPVHRWEQQPLAPDLVGARIPPGEVAVWDWIPWPGRESLHVVLVPRADILGRLEHQPPGAREPQLVTWPPVPQPEEIIN